MKLCTKSSSLVGTA